MKRLKKISENTGLIDSCEMCAADISVKSNYRCLCMKYVCMGTGMLSTDVVLVGKNAHIYEKKK